MKQCEEHGERTPVSGCLECEANDSEHNRPINLALGDVHQAVLRLADLIVDSRMSDDGRQQIRGWLVQTLDREIRPRKREPGR